MTSSVIVATKNRAKELSTLLMPSLLSQISPPGEVIFLDQSSDNGTKKLVESFEKRITGEKPRFLYLHETNHNGAASARNSAMDRTKADILIFLDDDVAVEPNTRPSAVFRASLQTTFLLRSSEVSWGGSS